MAKPTDADALASLFRTIRTRKVDSLERWMLDLARRAAAGSTVPSGYPTSTLGPPGTEDPEALTRVERDGAARAGTAPSGQRYGDPIEADPVRARYLEALAHLTAAADALLRLERYRLLDEMACSPTPPAGHREQACAERDCDGVVTERGRLGRCSACAKWRQRYLARLVAEAKAAGGTGLGMGYELVPPVPADVIDARRRQPSDRVHVSGPLAEIETGRMEP